MNQNSRFRTYSELFDKREEFNEDYIYVHWAGNKKKADVKVVETRKILTNDQVEEIIRTRLNVKEPFFRIKSDLINQGAVDSIIDDYFIKIVKVNLYYIYILLIKIIFQEIQNNQVENLRKKGKFTPDMSEEQKAEERRKLQALRASEKPAASPLKKE